MKKKSINTLTTLFLSLLMATAITACAMFPHTPANSDQAVKLRVEAFMTAKINKDWAKAYSFFDASYKETISEREFARKIEKMELKAFTIESVTVEPDGDQATVKVKTDISTGGFDFKGNVETQNWVREDSNWFLHVPPKDPKEVFK